jgi:cell division protein FtsW (lipid II flippase)
MRFPDRHLEIPVRFTMGMMTAATALQQASGAKVDIKTTETHSEWYTQPVWIVIGIIVLVLLIALIAMAGRKNNTTVVK